MDERAIALRRERDAIRSEMEHTVREMQQLEADIDARAPGYETLREHLNFQRQRLAELRQRMRAVMDASTSVVSAAAPSGVSRALYSTSSQRPSLHALASTPLQSLPPPVSPLPRPYNTPMDFNKSERGPSASQLPTAALSRSTSPLRRLASMPQGSGSDLMEQLATQQHQEVASLRSEFERLLREMEARHEQERVQLQQRVEEEERHQREFEEAKQRMEEAQRRLDAIKRAPTPLATRRQPKGNTSELEALAHRHF